MFFFSAFGLQVASDFQLPGASSNQGISQEVLHLTWSRNDELPRLGDEPRRLRSLLAFDGLGYCMLEGSDGHLLFAYGSHARFLLSPDAHELKCWARDRDDARWRRLLLDTVLWSISLRHGFELLHASAVTLGDRLIAVSTQTGGGKSSLAAELISRGGSLFTDDVIALLETPGGEVLAHPGPRLMNLPESIDPVHVGATALLHDFGDERWVEMQLAMPAARRLTALVLLNRLPGSPRSTATEPTTAVTLLPHMNFLSGLYEPGPEATARELRRFALASHLAREIAVLNLSADLTLTPTELADELVSAISRIS